MTPPAQLLARCRAQLATSVTADILSSAARSYVRTVGAGKGVLPMTLQRVKMCIKRHKV